MVDPVGWMMSRWSWFHPSDYRLEQFADGDLHGRRRTRVARHLEGCFTCRARVREIRALAEAIRRMPAPHPDPTLWDRIQSTLDSGPAVILPGEVAVPLDRSDIRGGLRALVATVVVIGVVVGAMVSMAPRLEADRSDLRLTPSEPRPGDGVHVTYRPDPFFRGEPRLIARVQLEGPDRASVAYPVHLEYVESQNHYEGTFRLPQWAAYGLIAVEDSTGDHVDANGGRLWDFVVHAPSGEPRFEGLQRQMDRHLTTRLHIAREAAHAMTSHYPDRAESWSRLHFAERLLGGPESVEELAQRHRTHLLELERLFGEQAPSEDDLVYMTLYARAVGGSAEQERWKRRLFAEASGSALAIQLRLEALRETLDERQLLEEHDRLWAERGPSLELARSATALAARLGRGEEAWEWGLRQIRSEGDAWLSVVRTLSTLPPIPAEAIDLVEEEISELDRPGGRERRPVGISVSEHRREVSARRVEALAAFALMLITSGRTAEGMDRLFEAADLAWRPDLYRMAADELMARGDTASAAPYIARLSVDPLADPPSPRVFERIGRAYMGEFAWEEELRRARVRMQEQVMASAVSRRLPSALPVQEMGGSRSSLTPFLENRVSVVALWYCFCDQFAPQMSEHVGMVDALSEMGIQVLNLVTGVMPQQGTVDVPHGRMGPSYFDTAGDASRAFGYSRTPSYFVVDATGALRFRYGSADDAVRQAYVLEEIRSTMVAEER